MEYQILLAPDLDLSPAGFVASWNEEAAAYNLPQARLMPAASKQYDQALLDAIVLSVTTGVASSALYDLIKRVVAKKKGGHTRTHIEERKKADGSQLLVVDIDEENTTD
jgi:hypothetical protein